MNNEPIRVRGGDGNVVGWFLSIEINGRRLNWYLPIDGAAVRVFVTESSLWVRLDE